jgi:hypothetical protein
MMDNIQLDRPLEETEALRVAADLCDATISPVAGRLAPWNARFRECLTLQVAGYLLRTGEHLPRPQWLAASLGMSTLELQIEAWKALGERKYRVALVVLRPVFESTLYAQACFVIPGFVDDWFGERLKIGTVSKILRALRPKLGERWVNNLKSNWDALNALSHANLFPTLATSITTATHGIKTLGLPLTGGMANEELAAALGRVWVEVAKGALVAQGLCVVSPRDKYPVWYVRHDAFLELSVS